MDSISSYINDFRAIQLDTSPEVQVALDIKDRLRTSILPWKGQFSPQLIEYLLGRHTEDRILDPFCGSGTVLYEAAAYHRSAIGLDINPAAVTLASFAMYCNLSVQQRVELSEHTRNCILKQLAKYSSETIGLDFCSQLPDEIFFRCYLLTLFGDKKETTYKRAVDAFDQLSRKLFLLPKTELGLNVQQGDARHTDYDAGSFNLVITSPPYINVFNYHQNYRPVMEALGIEPLAIAKAEIGANRKHRQNRFLTVVQYCIDMEAVFEELWRLLETEGKAIFVVGRSSKVRGISFYNAELIAAVAELPGKFSLQQREERVFTNRYGERIVEDILTFSRKNRSKRSLCSDEVGRLVGARALYEALESCENDAIQQELQDAYDRRDQIARSPRVS